MVNLPGNDDPALAVQVPFLVCQIPLPQPIIGSNVLDEMISGPKSSVETHAVVIGLLQKALGVEEDQAVAMVNFTQVRKTQNDIIATVRVGKEDVLIPAAKTVHVRCKVPPTLDVSDPVVLYEPPDENACLAQLSMGEGLLEISHTDGPWFVYRFPTTQNMKSFSQKEQS